MNQTTYKKTISMKHALYGHDYHVTLSLQKMVLIWLRRTHKKKKDVKQRIPEIATSQYRIYIKYILYYTRNYSAM